jgi:hypothetical protein
MANTRDETETLTTTSDDPRISEHWKSGTESSQKDRRHPGWFTSGCYWRSSQRKERVRLRAELSEQNHEGAEWPMRLETLKRLAFVEGYLTATSHTKTEIKPTPITHKVKKRPEDEKRCGYIESWGDIECVQYRVRKSGDVEYWEPQEDGTFADYSRILRGRDIYDSPRTLLQAKHKRLRTQRDALEKEIVQVEAQLTQLDVAEMGVK